MFKKKYFVYSPLTILSKSITYIVMKSLYFILAGRNKILFRLRIGGGYLIPLIMLVADMPIFCQTPLFVPKLLSEVNLPSEALTRYNTQVADTLNKAVYVGKLYDVRTSDMYDTLEFTLPGYTETFLAEANLITEAPDGEFTWSALLLNTYGSMSITRNSGGAFGYIQADQRYFRILPVNDSIQIVVEVESTEVATDSTSNNQGNNNTAQNFPVMSGPEDNHDCSFPAGFDTENPCQAIIAVCVIVTPEAKQWILEKSGFNDVNSFVKNTTQTVGQAFANSQIPNKRIDIMIIERDYSQCLTFDKLEWNYDEVPMCLFEDREALNFDLAIVLTEGGFNPAVFTRIEPDEGYYYSLIEASSFGKPYVFAHELGHLLGARHNWPGNYFGDDAASICCHAYCWAIPPESVMANQTYNIPVYETILAVHTQNLGNYLFQLSLGGIPYYGRVISTTPLLYYSNPNVLNQQRPVGKIWANNAAMIRTGACIVANFRETRHFTLDVVQTSCLHMPLKLTAVIGVPSAGLPGAGPYSIQWRYAGNIVGTGPVLTISQHYSCGSYWIECRATSSDGMTLKVWHKVDLRKENCVCNNTIGPSGKGLTGTTGSVTTENDVQVVPNPIREGVIRASCPSWAGVSCEAVVYNIQGQVVASQPIVFDIQGNTSLQSTSLPAGLYWLQCKTLNAQSGLSKFVVHHSSDSKP